MARRKGRILAFQALYAWDITGMSVPDLLEFSWLDNEKREKNDAELLTFTSLLISGTIEHVGEIDAYIKSHLKGWDFNRVNKVDVALLRISVYTLLFQKDIHPNIVIDEAIAISKEYGSDDAFKFINGVLDSIKNNILKTSA